MQYNSTMTIDIVTLFPDMFKGPFDESMVKRAREKQIVTIGIHNLRNWSIDERGTVDAHPYGGGPGMLLRPEPLFKAVNELKHSYSSSGSEKSSRRSNSKEQAQKVILLDAGGKKFKQETAIEYSKLDHLICLCGHYEGVDYRVHESLVDDVLSIGDFVLTGGELPAMMVVDSVVRLLPGVLNKEEGHEIESFSYQFSVISSQSEKNQISKTSNPQPITDNRKLVEYPQYTRPEDFGGMKVPDVLLSGHHAEIEKWRQENAVERTKKNRPDLLK